MESIKGIFLIIIIACVAFVLGSFMAWYYAILSSVIVVVVLPPLIKTFFWDTKFGAMRPIPDMHSMPDEILLARGATDWELEFAEDMKRKLKDEEFVKKITRKQCRKLIEVYLERVRGVKEKEVDIKNLNITIDGRRIQ